MGSEVETQSKPETEGTAREEEESDGNTATMEEVLAQLGLESLIETFRNEQVDYDSLVRIGRSRQVW